MQVLRLKPKRHLCNVTRKNLICYGSIEHHEQAKLQVHLLRRGNGAPLFKSAKGAMFFWDLLSFGAEHFEICY